ncbi:MAG: TIGR04211 family SH3 domain-containing protein [Marinobacterium sp.]|nr:TIGR04211 family SH3 domain-containing protein [Marinobacterium sp.]
MKKLVISALLILTAGQALAEKGHISDAVSLFMHGGPGKQYRITGRTNSGDSVEILDRDSGSKYVKVRTYTGREGWVPAKYVKTGLSIKERLPAMEEQLQASRDKLDTQRAEYNSLNSRYDELNAEKQAILSQVSQLNDDIRRLQLELDTRDESNLLRWFTHGGLVALGGVILGLILPAFGRRKKRRDDW